MKVACLQFAPLVGDVDNNLNRADAVLNRAKDEDLEDLDLLVLPELAFTGYNFKSLQEISPFLEHSGSGISSLWARTTALKYDCAVAVGYPEKVDVAQHWPTSPEYYSAAIIVNNDGETVANYRKSFLHSFDETWALESRDGFFNQQLPGLGNTAMGICMDLNPYRFEAPWNAFEFAYHILESEANVVIVTMSWFTLEDRRQYSRMPQEPDLETLTYWVQRLEPLIRAEREDEIIVVFCNRTGVEGDVVYAGTSAVLGVCAGEVNVYGLLGRGVKELLVVDTANPPIAKLVHCPNDQLKDSVTPIAEVSQPFQEIRSKTIDYTQARRTASLQLEPAPRPGYLEGPVCVNPRSRRAIPPRITIPEKPYQTTQSVRITEESPGVDTPTAPSPTPLSLRPSLQLPLNADQRGLPETQLSPMDGKYRVYGGHVSICHGQQTPSTPFFDDEPEPLSARYYWASSNELVQSPLEPREVNLMPQTPTFASTLVLLPTNPENSSMLSPPPPSLLPHPISDDNAIRPSDGAAAEVSEGSVDLPELEAQDDVGPTRPSSPKSRNASRSRQQNRRDSEACMTEDFATIGRRIEAMMHRPASAMAAQFSSQQPGMTNGERPRSPKSRNASRTTSRTRTFEVIDMLPDERLESNMSRASIPIVASPSCFHMASSEEQLAFVRRSLSLPFQHGRDGSDVPRNSSRSETRSRPDSRLASGPFRTVSRGRQPQSQSVYNVTPEAIAAVNIERQRSLQSRSIGQSIVSANISPDDEIIAIEEIPSLHCQVHGLQTSPDQVTTIRAATSDDEIIAIVGPPGSSNPIARLRGSPGSIHSEGQARMVARTNLNGQTRHTESQPNPTTTTSEFSRTSSLIANDLSDILNLGSTDSLPLTSGDSFGSLLSRESPATPVFAPTTPKAMKLFLDNDDLPEAPVSASATSYDTGLAVLLGTEIVLPTDRPKSAVW